MMSYDGKLLARAKERLDNMRRTAEKNRLSHLEEAYRLSPRIRELDSQISANIADAVGFALSKGRSPLRRLRKPGHNERLQAERANGFQVGFPLITR